MTDAAKKQDATSIQKLTGDGWENITTGIGTTRDKRYRNQVKPVSPSTDRAKWEDLYFGDDMAAKIVDVPVEDMVREWISVSVDSDTDADGNRGGDAQDSAEIADGMLQFLDDLKAKRRVTEGVTWAKVFGGGVVFLGVDDGQTDLTEPLNEERIRSFDHLTAYDRWEIEIFRQYDDPTDPRFGTPMIYRFVSDSGERGGQVRPETLVHESRIARFNGIMTNRRRKRRNDGWDDPILMRVDEVLGDFGTSWGGAAHLMADFAQAVFKMKGLGDAVASQEGNLVLERMAQMDLCRSTVRAIPIDAEDEDFMRQQTPMSGMPETLDRFMLRLAAAARMPVTLLFGQSPAGLNTTADGDIKFWHARVAAMQETDLRGPLERIVELGFKSPNGPTSGKEPDGWALSFNPLDHPTEAEQAANRKVVAETDAIYIDTGVLDADEVRQSRYGGETYSTDTHLTERPEFTEPPAPEPPPMPIMVPQPPLADPEE